MHFLSFNTVTYLFLPDADCLHCQTQAYTMTLYSLHAGMVQIDTGEVGASRLGGYIHHFWR